MPGRLGAGSAMLGEEEWFRFANEGISGPVVVCSLPSRLSTAIGALTNQVTIDADTRSICPRPLALFYVTVEYACNAFAIGLFL